MKKNIFLLLLILFIINVKAQQNYKAQIEPNETGNVGKPVLMLKNGVTVFQEDNEELKTMFLRLYDKNHKLIIKKPISFGSFTYPNNRVTTQLIGWYEIGGHPVVIISVGGTNFKVTFNENNAEIIENKKFFINASDPLFSLWYEKKFFYFDSKTESFMLLEKEGQKHYGYTTDLKETRYFMSFLDSNMEKKPPVPVSFINDTYNMLELLDVAYLDGNVYFSASLKRVNNDMEYKLCNGINELNGGDIYIIKYDAKANKWNNKLLFKLEPNLKKGKSKKIYSKILPDENNEYLTLRYYYLIETEKGTRFSDGKEFFEIFFQTVTAETLKDLPQFSMPSAMLNDFVTKYCKKSGGYKEAFISSTTIDKHGNIFCIRAKNLGSDYNPGSPEMLGVSLFTNEGKEINAWAYPYNTNGAGIGFNNNFTYLPVVGKSSNFIILNNDPANFNKPLSSSPNEITNIQKCELMGLEFNEKGITPFFPFGDPDKKNPKYADLRNALYDKKTNTLIFKLWEGGQDYKNTHPAWIKFD